MMGLPPQLKMVGTLFPTPKPILLRSNNNTFLLFSEARWLTSLKRTSYHSLTVTRVILVVIGSSLETTTTTTQVVVNSLSQPVRPPDRGQSSVPATPLPRFTGLHPAFRFILSSCSTCHWLHNLAQKPPHFLQQKPAIQTTPSGPGLNPDVLGHICTGHC